MAPPPLLRPLRQTDAPAVLDAFTSSVDMARQGDVTTLAGAEAYVARHATQPVFAVVADDRLVGAVGIMLDEANHNGWFWYWMHAGWRGRGWTAAAAATVADWALGPGGCERLELGHRVNNPASGRVAAAAGFVLEGRERAKFLVDGERVDVLIYGRLRSDPVPEGRRLALTAPVPSQPRTMSAT
ncbi:GNAT family N-acetyltransferase [Oceanitalea stevensii]|uniref:GNAT family N-acetyltransferase n=1 Tax=Oceanitalea stevensii TaxID=2763072 RepID=A0ABR8Z1Z7_9MICO|nr:GNAT family protein [Oceanitalea stevensii]MBD8062343.1 GNAT family N-acetyltransferase [Oceanitalea stevensii]